MNPDGPVRWALDEFLPVFVRWVRRTHIEDATAFGSAVRNVSLGRRER